MLGGVSLLGTKITLNILLDIATATITVLIDTTANILLIAGAKRLIFTHPDYTNLVNSPELLRYWISRVLFSATNLRLILHLGY